MNVSCITSFLSRFQRQLRIRQLLLYCALTMLAVSHLFPAKSFGADFPRRKKAQLNSAPALSKTEQPVPESAPVSEAVTNGVDLSATDSTNRMANLDDKHRLAIGDKLSFRIEEDLEDPKPMMVTDSGDVEVPYIGRFPAEGKTCKQLAQEIKSALEKDYYFRATVVIAVDLMTKSRGKVYLVGPVRAPGPQEIPSDEILTIGKAILRAGGFTDYADKKNVKITRKGSGGHDTKTMIVDVDQIFEKGKTEKDLALEPGDLILIPERLVRF